MAAEVETNECGTAELKAAFEVLDRDGDGCITAAEICVIMSGLHGHAYTETEVQNMVNDFDQDGNGTLDFEEFAQLLCRHQEGVTSSDELWEAFMVFDKDGNGYVSTDELREVLSIFKYELTEEQLDLMIKAVDTDHDGRITYIDFQEYMQPLFELRMEDLKIE